MKFLFYSSSQKTLFCLCAGKKRTQHPFSCFAALDSRGFTTAPCAVDFPLLLCCASGAGVSSTLASPHLSDVICVSSCMCRQCSPYTTGRGAHTLAFRKMMHHSTEDAWMGQAEKGDCFLLPACTKVGGFAHSV